MEGSSKKKGASGKGDKDRTPAIFRDLLERCKANNLEEFIMPAILSQKPKAGQMWNTYLMDKESLSGYSNENYELTVKVYVAFPNYEKNGQPLRIYIKNTKASSGFLKTLCSVLPKYERIMTLK